MKQNENFVLREVYGAFLLVPIMNNEISNNIISFNETGASIFKAAKDCQNKIELSNAINNKYNPSNDSKTEELLNRFIDSLIEMRLIEE
jgi:hypothetical protein